MPNDKSPASSVASSEEEGGASPASTSANDYSLLQKHKPNGFTPSFPRSRVTAEMREEIVQELRNSLKEQRLCRRELESPAGAPLHVLTPGPSSRRPCSNRGSPSSSSDGGVPGTNSRVYSGVHAVAPSSSGSSFFSSASNIGIEGGQFSVDSSSYRNNTNLTINLHHGPPADNVSFYGEPVHPITRSSPSSLPGSTQYNPYPRPGFPYYHAPGPFESANTTGHSFPSTRYIRDGFNHSTHPYDNTPTPWDVLAESSRTGRRQRPTEEHIREQPMAKRVRRASPQSYERRSSRSGLSSDSNDELADNETDNGRRPHRHQPLEPTFAPPPKKRTRTLTTPHQSAVLHALLAQSRFPTTAMREEVGRSIGLSARKVQIWFQNQRLKARRPRSQSDAPTPALQYAPFPSFSESMSRNADGFDDGMERGPYGVSTGRHSPEIGGGHLESSTPLRGPGTPGVPEYHPATSKPSRWKGRDPTGSSEQMLVAQKDSSAAQLQDQSESSGLQAQKSSDIYCRHLSVKQRGFPLWIPEPNCYLPIQYQRKGISIGDVGIITAAGSFDYLFNVLLAHDHPFNAGRVPPGFAPLLPPLDPSDIRGQLEFRSNSYIASSSVKRTLGNSDDLGTTFHISASEGAILTIPDGALSEDLGNLVRLRRYMSENVESWYRHANGPRGRELANGDLRLVIGCDKTTAWGMAAFANLSQGEDTRLRFKPVGATYGWELHSGTAEVRSGPDAREIRALSADDMERGGEPRAYENQCIFVRTLNATLHNTAWLELMAELKVPDDSGGSASSKDVATSETPGERPISRAGEPFRENDMSADSQVGNNSLSADGSNDRVTVHKPDVPAYLSSHPSKTLNAAILQQYMDAKMAITDDSDWSSMLTENDIVMPKPRHLTERILANSTPVRDAAGVVYLQKNIAISLPPLASSAGLGLPMLPLRLPTPNDLDDMSFDMPLPTRNAQMPDLMSILQGAANITIHGGTFTAVSPTGSNLRASTDIVTLLLSHSATAGLLDAAERFDAPKCDEGTRTSMLREMKNFVQQGGPSSVFWLHGPAGIGKSALAQSLALSLKDEGDHAASFFFSRTAPGRNDGNQLIVTLACQLALSIPAIKPLLAKVVKENPLMFSATNAIKMQALIVDPINQLHKMSRWKPRLLARRIVKRKLHPRLILVDGLDECNDPRVQQDLLICIGNAVRQLSLPFRFVIASRPESHILATFELDTIFQGPHAVKVSTKNLGDDEDADEQITTFLLKEFAEIRRGHPIREFLPNPWPLPGQIAQLVTKSSKGFIYPATVIRYIKMPNNRPDECLERILGLSEIPIRDKPYEPLDTLYRYIFESVPDVNKDAIRDIFHFLVLPSTLYSLIAPRVIERHYHYMPGHVQHVLRDLLCLVAFTGNGPIKVLHASMPDFLLDQSRSGPLCIDIDEAHATIAASFALDISQSAELPNLNFGEAFLGHIMQARVSHTLLHSRLVAVNFRSQYIRVCHAWSLYYAQQYDHGEISLPEKDLEGIAFVAAYLLVLVIKNIVKQADIKAHIADIKLYVLQKFSFAASLQAVRSELAPAMIPLLRRWTSTIAGHSEYIDYIFAFKVTPSQCDLRDEIFQLYLLMMAPFFGRATGDESSHQNIHHQPRTQQLASFSNHISLTLLEFLLRYYGWSHSVSRLKFLAVDLLGVSLAHADYSAPLITLLKETLSSGKRPNEVLMGGYMPKLIPIATAYLDRVFSEAPAGSRQCIQQLGAAWRRYLDPKNSRGGSTALMDEGIKEALQ
ncbi:hypothetical protein D9619_004392 [Psilocybe cf. subviscida]|uniref:Homeobox domain-containing protein n=1 Tax=Psilocybe cf. subviscida TaxID=2480587 RepID=A0A8H5BPW0_9AGAR|nr:hypothetical protein D9619_004392 [Psilocybe cf. subviscida]